jgi:hypothetical protein
MWWRIGDRGAWWQFLGDTVYASGYIKHCKTIQLLDMFNDATYKGGKRIKIKTGGRKMN